MLRKLARSAVQDLRLAIRTIHQMRLRAIGVTVGRDVVVQGRTSVFRAKDSNIELGDRVVLNALTRKNTLEARGSVVLRTFRPGARIVIGADSGLTSCTISAGSSVEIGQRVLVGGGVIITDSDHHVVDMLTGRRFAGLPSWSNDRSVSIGDDVFVGARSIILKGAEIGEGSVIGAGSVVSSVIPAGVIAVGNPCRVLRALDSSRP
ncbi:acyltransferase [Paenarthrobacter sp. 22069]|uniref:acyltransferase n=1 Tax=Paenarthrobacter sp. 22069 TaxID=3453864 RepID=UPI003F86D056